jgi:adenine C2-methylase RlmN of 23S rRNA A2503 and tRNA A37
MSDAINLKTDKAIRKLMVGSTWGRANSVQTLTANLQDEFDELSKGIERKDIANCFEESADVLMLVLCILYRLSPEENTEYTPKIVGLICSTLQCDKIDNDAIHDVDEAIRKSSKPLNNIKDSDQELLHQKFRSLIQSIEKANVVGCFEKSAALFLAMLCVLKKLSPDEPSYISKVLKLLNEKLYRRYKSVLDDSDGNKTFDIDAENAIWQRAKIEELRYDLLYCPNPLCLDYCDISVAPESIEKEGNKGICRSCGKKFRINRKCILLGEYRVHKREYLSILADAVIRYHIEEDMALSAEPIDETKEQRAAHKALLTKIVPNDEKTLAFIKYMRANHPIDERVTMMYLNEAKNIPIPERRDVFSDYVQMLRKGRIDSLQSFSASDMREIRKHLSSLKGFPVESPIMATLKFAARGWDTQVTRKLLLKIDSERVIECMAIIHYNKVEIRDLTFELSNMYGCPVKCSFCASGELTANCKNLKALDYIRQINSLIDESSLNPNEFQKFYVSFAGIGEPSLLGKEISIGMRLITDMYPHVRFNIATIGYRPQSFSVWQKNHDNIRTIQIPFFSANDDVLRRIATNLPGDYDLERIVTSALRIKNTNHECRFKINYIVICGHNDTDEAIEQLCSFLAPWKHQVEIKISYLNETEPSEEHGYYSPSERRMKEIHKIITAHGYTAYIFGTKENHKLGCGQLAQRYLREGKAL